MAKIDELYAELGFRMGSSAPINRFNQRLDHLGRRAREIGRSMSLRVTAPIVAFGALSLRAAGNFEGAMKEVQALSGASGDEFERMNDLAKKLGRETQFSASQAAGSLRFLAMAGFSAEKAMGALPATLQLAAAAKIELADAADITTNIMSGYGFKAEELGRVNDVLAKTFTSSNTNLLNLGEAMKYAGPTASAAGVQFEQVAAMVGLFGNAGIQGSLAGTSMRNSISRMLNPTKQMRELMEKNNLSFLDANGRLLDFKDILKQLEPHSKNAGLFLKIFGERAGPAITAAVSQGVGALTELQTKIENSGGTAARIAAKQMEGFNGAIKALVSAFEGLQIAIGDAGFLEFATNIVNKLVEWTRALADLNPTVLAVVTAIVGFIGVVGPLLLGLGALIAASSFAIGGLLKLVTVFGWAVTAAAALKAGILAMNLALIMNPIALVIAGVATFITLAYYMIRHWDKVKEFFAGMFESIRHGFANMIPDWLHKKIFGFSLADSKQGYGDRTGTESLGGTGAFSENPAQSASVVRREVAANRPQDDDDGFLAQAYRWFSASDQPAQAQSASVPFGEDGSISPRREVSDNSRFIPPIHRVGDYRSGSQTVQNNNISVSVPVKEATDAPDAVKDGVVRGVENASDQLLGRLALDPAGS